MQQTLNFRPDPQPQSEFLPGDFPMPIGTACPRSIFTDLR
jgi:hypothetical protein